MRHGSSTSSRRRCRVLAIAHLARGDVPTALSTAVIAAVRMTSDVVEAQSAADALRLTNARAFDVAVVDCSDERRLENTRCVDLITTMWRRHPWLPVVLIGKAPGERLRADVLLTGVRDVLMNDLNPRMLLKSISSVARQHGTPPPSVGNIATIQRVCAFLDEHIADGPSLRDLARMTRLSRSHFSRTFHAVLGMPLRFYVRELRLKRAYALLSNGNLSLTVIAIECGFYDLPHFDKAFRRRLGISPRTFRARYHARRVAGPFSNG